MIKNTQKNKFFTTSHLNSIFIINIKIRVNFRVLIIGMKRKFNLNLICCKKGDIYAIFFENSVRNKDI